MDVLMLGFLFPKKVAGGWRKKASKAQSPVLEARRCMMQGWMEGDFLNLPCCL